MSNEQNDQLMIIPTSGLVGLTERPQSLDPNDLSGTEDIRLDEIKLPRLAIAQGLSPQLIPGESEYIKGLTIGDMFNDVTGQIYGPGPVTVVPVKRHVTRIEFDPNDRKVPIDRNVPAGDPRLQWTRGTGPNGEDEPPRATEYVEFICLLLVPGFMPERVVVSIKTTNKQMRQAATLWNTYIKMRSAAIYSGMYTLQTRIVTGQNKKGEKTAYGVFIVKNAGFVPKDTPLGAGLFRMAKDFADSLEGREIVLDRDGVVDDEAVADTSFDPSKFEGAQPEM